MYKPSSLRSMFASALKIVQNADKLVADAAKDLIGAEKPKFNRNNPYYMAPGDFYNHRSKTFLKNKRRGL